MVAYPDPQYIASRATEGIPAQKMAPAEDAFAVLFDSLKGLDQSIVVLRGRLSAVMRDAPERNPQVKDEKKDSCSQLVDSLRTANRMICEMRIVTQDLIDRLDI